MRDLCCTEWKTGTEQVRESLEDNAMEMWSSALEPKSLSNSVTFLLSALPADALTVVNVNISQGVTLHQLVPQLHSPREAVVSLARTKL